MKQFGGGVLKGKRKIVSAILSVLCAAVLFCGFFAVKNTSQTQSADALNTSTINSATKIGGGEDLWDSATGAFNVTVANDLSLKLFNYGDAVDYIKEHADAREKTWTNSTVVPASVINATIEDTAKQKYGYVVKLGGLDWMIASLTLGGYDSETKEEGEIPVLTLYLADDLTTSKYYSGGARNVYSSSALRKIFWQTVVSPYSRMGLLQQNIWFSRKKSPISIQKRCRADSPAFITARMTLLMIWLQIGTAVQVIVSGELCITELHTAVRTMCMRLGEATIFGFRVLQKLVDPFQQIRLVFGN